MAYKSLMTFVTDPATVAHALEAGILGLPQRSR